MLVHRSPTRGRLERFGFTLIELLVVISIIAVLASLILPGVQQARATARRTQCLNNLRNVGIAALSYITATGGEFPPLVGKQDYIDTTVIPNVSRPMPWTVHLLPHLEQAPLYIRLEAGTPGPGEILENINIASLTCPDDPTSDEPGASSFVANAGYTTGTSKNSTAHRLQYYDWPANGFTLPGTPDIEDYRITFATGLFWRQPSPSTEKLAAAGYDTSYNSTSLRANLARVRDGTAQTLMFTENLNSAGWLPAPVLIQEGGGAGTAELAFVGRIAAVIGHPEVPLDNVTASMSNPIGDSTMAGVTIETALQPLLLGSASVFNLGKSSRINGNLTNTEEGAAARPSSYHPQLVNVIFVDGHARSLHQGINDTVYMNLISPNGTQYGQALLSDTNF